MSGVWLFAMAVVDDGLVGTLEPELDDRVLINALGGQPQVGLWPRSARRMSDICRAGSAYTRSITAVTSKCRGSNAGDFQAPTLDPKRVTADTNTDTRFRNRGGC